LLGPTSFAPMIRKAIEIVKKVNALLNPDRFAILGMTRLL
jgi:hypothetical protein